MPPPTHNPCRVCACWAKAEVASTAVRSAQNPVARSVPMSPLHRLERVCRGSRRRAFAWSRGGEGKLQTNRIACANVLRNNAKAGHFKRNRDTGGSADRVWFGFVKSRESGVRKVGV